MATKKPRPTIEFRPSPPDSLIKKIISSVSEKRPSPLQLCVDVGCGSGQSTEQLATSFERVIGVDVSPDQLELRPGAEILLRIFLTGTQAHREGSAYSIPVDNNSVDLVSVCAAVHWFDMKPFYAEVDRVLQPGGILACYSYHGCSPVYQGQSFRKEFIEIWDRLNEYWSEGHNHLRTDYSELPQLYSEDFLLRGFSVEQDVSLDAVIGYISSWSALSKKREKEGDEAADRFVQDSRNRLLSAMGTQESNPPMKRRYDYFLRFWRKPIS
ncbi:putative methyltransferase DDB_G0268948 [Macrobrachium nipponense]|uniref:putative methyltransferase DDB_G0268948 n=1 Tax=Macrobrachium nipponense TaxID=159736 RepID=UPI0030C7FE46